MSLVPMMNLSRMQFVPDPVHYVNILQRKGRRGGRIIEKFPL